MSYPLLTLPKGLTFKYKKSPLRSTIKQTPQSGRHPASATLQSSTIFNFELNFSYLKNAGMTTANDQLYLQAFYEAMGGGTGWFLFDPSQNDLENLTVVQDYTQLQNGFCGQSDGTKTVFPLWRSTAALGGGNVTLLERIQHVTLFTGLYSNGTLIPSADYTLTDLPAQVTFATAPAAANITWAGSYCYLAQFAEDSIDFDEFMYQLWTLQTLKIQSVNI